MLHFFGTFVNILLEKPIFQKECFFCQMRILKWSWDLVPGVQPLL